MNRALVVVVFAVGCKGGGTKVDKPPEPPTPAVTDNKPAPPPAPAGPTCADRSARLAKRMTELAAATPGFMPLIKDVAAPDAAGGKPFDTRGLVLAVTVDGKVFTQGQELTKELVPEYLKQLAMQIMEAHAMAGGHAKDPVGPLYIWADRAAPASAVAALIAAAAEWKYEPRLIVAAAGSAAPVEDPALLAVPAVKPIADKLPTVEPDATQYLVGVLRTAMNPCSDVITPFATASSKGDPASQTAGLISDLPAGLTKCDCKLGDADLFEWGVHVWFGATAPGMAWVAMPKIAKGEKKTVGELVSK